jgi:hypothetical protein
MHRLARFRKLAAWERVIFLRALFLLPVVSVAIRIVGLKRTWTWLEAGARRTRSDRAASRDDPAHVAWLVMAAARHGLVRASCLPISLTVQRLLREHGIETAVRLGVRKIDGRLEAHAWVEKDGEPLSDDAQASGAYAAFEAPMASRAGASR